AEGSMSRASSRNTPAETIFIPQLSPMDQSAVTSAVRFRDMGLKPSAVVARPSHSPLSSCEGLSLASTTYGERGRGMIGDRGETAGPGQANSWMVGPLPSQGQAPLRP